MRLTPRIAALLLALSASSAFAQGAANYPAKSIRIVVTTLHRSPALPDVPAIAESGLPGYDSCAPKSPNGRRW